MYSARDTLSGGLPHSEIPGSTIARISPGLFAACHVLHRLSVPRHPPDALNSRLSATPNGKDHPCSKARQTLLSEDTTGSHKQPVRHTKPRSRPRSPASVTQLASSPCAINNSHPGIPKDFAGGKFGSAAAFFKGGAPDAGLSAFAAQTPAALAETCSFVGGGGERARTVDLLLAKQALSQLSYTPVQMTEDG